MALRYLIMPSFDGQGPSGLAAAVERSLGWVSRKLGSYLLCASDPSAVIPLPARGGVVLGTVFACGVPSRPVRTSADWHEPLNDDPMNALLRRHWGGYVAVVPTSRGIAVLRDPSGAIPCLVACVAGEPVLVSDVGVLEMTGNWASSVSSNGIARSLYTTGLPEIETALTGVQELLAGCQATLSGRSIEFRHRWSPWPFALSGCDCHDRPGQGDLRFATSDAVAACCGISGKMLLGVSGGLDSSIVAACVPEADDRLACVTMWTKDAMGDERTHARALADHLGSELFETPFGFDASDVDVSVAAHLPRPNGRTTMLPFARVLDRLSVSIGAVAVLSGHGGDNVFGYTQTAAPVVDRLEAEGLGRGVFSTALDIAAMTGSSVATVLRAAWRRVREPARQWRPDARFLAADVIVAQGKVPVDHLWLRAPTGTPPAKAAHVASLLRAHIHVDGVLPRSGPPTLHPLLTQPVVETCLAIPSWHWCEGGINRSVARRAFADVLPGMIVRRSTKGGPDGYSRDFFDRFRPAIRDRLLDGQLAGSGVLDRKALEAVFASDVDPLASDRVRLFALLDAEAWLAHWSGRLTGTFQSGVGRDPAASSRAFSACQRGRSGCEPPP